MSTALPFASPDTCPAPGGGGSGCDPTPVPNGGAYAPLPQPDVCEPSPIPRYGGECVGEEVEILLPDGSTCDARDIKAGDSIIGLDPSGSRRAQLVLSVSASVQQSLKIVAGDLQIVCSTSHLLMTSPTETIRADELTFGTKIFTGDGSLVQVNSVVGLGKVPVVTWVCEPDHTYIAAGLLNHNKTAIPVAEETI